MNKIFGLLSVLLLATLPVMADTYELKTGPFDKLNLNGDFNVIYRSVPDSAGCVTYVSDANLNEVLDIRIKKGKLTIKKSDVDILFSTVPTIHVYSDFLTNVKCEGGGTLTVENSAVVPEFSATLIGNGKIIVEDVDCTGFKANIDTGNGTIVARGKCSKASFRLTGSGVIQADALAANEVNCTVLGTGTIGCNPLDVLDVKGFGTAKVYYYGAPTVKSVGNAKLVALKGTPTDSSQELKANSEDESEVDEESDFEEEDE